jgi:hypothetical protein
VLVTLNNISPERRRKRAVSVSVFVDNVRFSQVLSYLVPADMRVRPGDAVEIPFGKTSQRGMIVELHNEPGKATRFITHLYGVRAEPQDVAMALNVARHHFVPQANVLKRLSPATGKGAAPIDPGPVRLRQRFRFGSFRKEATRELIVTGPGTNTPLVAASAAQGLCTDGGQVLVLCASVNMVDKIMEIFEGGAVRLDANAPAGSWTSFRDGLAPVGVGTRSSALYSANNLTGIVVVDEDHIGHQEFSQPYTNARDVASARSRSWKCKLVLISSAPTPSALTASSSVTVLPGSSSWPRIVVSDRVGDGEARSAVTPEMASAIARAKRAGREVIVLTTSKEAVSRCSGCGAVRVCSKHPGSECGCLLPECCSVCGSTKTRFSGWDTARLSTIFREGVSIGPVKNFAGRTEPATVIIYDIDGSLYAPSLLPETAGVHLLVRAGELATGKGEVVVGTTNSRNATLREVAAGKGLLPWSRRCLTSAGVDLLPPKGRMVTVTFFRKTPPDVSLWPGVVSTPLLVKAGTWEVVIRIEPSKLLDLEPFISKARKGSKARVKVS